jgi:uncharacterized protein (TIGR02246 family)
MHYALYQGPGPQPHRPAPERIRPALLHQIPERFARAWNRHDMVAAFADFDPNADFVDVDGTQMLGHDMMVARFAALHRTVYRHSFLRIDHVDLRRTSDDSALLRADWTMKLPEGTRSGTLLFVVARRGYPWRVVSAQNTEETAAARFVVEAP